LADGDPVVSDLSRRDVDGRQGNHLFPDRREVSEQLRMGGPIAVPVGAHSPAALVVENREPAALERIEAIDAQAQLLARQAKARRVLRMPHAKGSASPLDLEQPCDEPRGAATLARQRWTRNRVLARGLECCRRLRDTGVEQLVELRRGERHQRTRVAELIPELLQSGVQQLAARIGRNARLWHAKLLTPQTQLRIGPEGALILQLEAARARGKRLLRAPRDTGFIAPLREQPRTVQPRRQPYRAACLG